MIVNSICIEEGSKDATNRISTDLDQSLRRLLDGGSF